MKKEICVCGHSKASHGSGKYYCQKGFKKEPGIEICKCMAYSTTKDPKKNERIDFVEISNELARGIVHRRDAWWLGADEIEHALRSIEKRTIERMRKYLGHKEDCTCLIATLNRFKCSCGLDDLLTAVTAVKEKS